MSLSRYIFFWLILYTVSLAAANTIKGHITNTESGEPLIGANIMLTGTSLGSAADENGAYIIENIPIGNYTLKAMFIGYETLEKEIRVEGNQEYTTNITLKPSVIEIQETKVTAEKRKEKVTGAPASIEIVTSRDIKGKTTTNMGAYLKGLKGIDFTSSGINNYSISVRGFNSSFNTRLLTLSDGRVANLPALRVINYSTIPQSMDDVEKIEVVLGPATALYGANAHSGVVNIISKSPAHSEGLSMSISGSSDERQLRKINGRFAQKLTNSISIKLSGMYLHAYDWPYISEEEYKSHLYPWSLSPGRTSDGKDNNPWNTRNDDSLLIWGINIDGDSVRIGNGEAMDTGDPDDDGVMGEDWYNGYDDDGDGLIDEDYFTANGLDDDGDGLIDEEIDKVQDFAYDGVDNDHNGIIDDEAGDGYIEESIKHWGINIDNNLLIRNGRKDSLINDEINLFYISNNNSNNWNVTGDHRYREDKVRLEFDIYTYDFGKDGLQGSPFIDLAGDGEYQQGESLYNFSFDKYMSDCGLDGICYYSTKPFDLNDDGDFIDVVNNIAEFDGELNPDWPGADADGTEGDGIWQPGDGWVDSNGNGQVDKPDNFIGDSWQQFTPENFTEHDVWPLPNGYWDDNEDLYSDLNNNKKHDDNEPILSSGLAMDGFAGEPFTDCGFDDLGDLICEDDENWNDTFGNGKYDVLIQGEGTETYSEVYIDLNNNNGYDAPTGEFDGVFDTGDGIYGHKGEKIVDENGNGILDPGEEYIDENGDGLYNAPDYDLTEHYQPIVDRDGDGLSDYPDFEIDNRKVELRLDFDPNPDFNMTFQSGYSWTKTQQVTGTSRYIADGFEYKFYQIRSRYRNWFVQVYMNQSFSGKTRGYNLGNRIIDKSKNYAAQIQNNFDIPSLNTKFVWGTDYFMTDPNTYGTILNDGPNGYDNDGDNVHIRNDGIDNDGDDLLWGTDEIDNDDDGEIDETDEGGIDDFICPDGKGEGFRKGKYWECGEGIDEPDEFIDPASNEYGLYYQSTTELFGTSRFELITAARLDYHDLLAEGVQFAPKLGLIYKPDAKSSMRFTYGKAYNTPNSITLFTDLFVGSRGNLNIYLRGNKDGTPYCRVGKSCFGSEVYTVVEPSFYSADRDTVYKIGTLDDPNYFDGYNERVEGAPYFYKVHPGSFTLLAGDMVPLDTSVYLIFVPELNGDGVLYTTKESINLPDVEPIRTEKIQTVEFGYKGFLGNKTHFSLDAYLSYYEDFFSPPTFITPLVVAREFDDDDNDITNIYNLDIIGLMPINDIGTNPPFGTAWNGLDDDGDWEEWADEFGWGDTPDPGEWGIVMFEAGQKNGVPYDAGQIFHPYEILFEKDGFPGWKEENFPGLKNGKYDAVGVDEIHSTAGLSEYEPVNTGLIGSDDLPIIAGGNASNITDIVLSPMNYGDVWMQGCDIGITHFISNKLIVDGNVSWYGTTEFYNELTKKNDPINAPKWKWNANIKWNSDLGDVIVNFRHVDQFKWSDGIWLGVIGPYNILDLFYTYHITENLDFNLSVLNLNNDRHKELIGGAVMGRQIVMRFTSTF